MIRPRIFIDRPTICLLRHGVLRRFCLRADTVRNIFSDGRGFIPLEIRQAHRRDSSSLTGFTLIELLVSISIFAVIGVVLYSSFRGGATSWRRINSELALQQRIRYLLNEMGRDSRNMIFLSNLPFEGSADKIKFVAPVKSAADKGIDMARVSYYLSFDEEEMAGGAIIRTEEPIKNALSAEADESEGGKKRLTGDGTAEKGAHKREVLFSGVSKLTFSYLAAYKGGGEGEAEVEYEWIDSWEAKEALPTGVKIELTLTNPEDGSNITLSKRIFVPMGKPIEEMEVPGVQ